MVKKSNSDRPTWLELRDTWQETKADLSEVFAKLNWGRPEIAQFSVLTKDGETFDVKPVATLKNFHALQINVPVALSKTRVRNVQREVSKHFPDNVLIARDPDEVRIEWPRRKPDGDVKYDTFTTSIEQPHQLTFQKLAGAGFEISELSRATLEDVRARIYGLSTESVTKLFYEQFRDEHDKLAASITSDGDLSNEDRHSYASLLLNRLMFVYFLQKKEFLSGDTNLLNNVLTKCDETSTKYFNEALLPLFFEGFNGQNSRFESERLNDWWGEIPYINGGIFAAHGVEDKAALGIPNHVFARVFEFFEKFDWHLDSRPIGTSNEINPEVLGYIFEQYINYTADGKKESGAYYTPEDVTGYMVAQTLIPRILDEFVKISPGCLSLVKTNPSDYIHRSLFHGAKSSSPLVWLEAPLELSAAWEGDPCGWNILDEAGTNPDISLPGETWVEMFYRRARVEALINNLSTNGVEQVNDIITLNLNGSKLVSDLIAQIEDGESIRRIWMAVSELSVIDPTCGSGAFLFAALTAMEPIYEDLLESLGDDANSVGEQFGRGNVKYQIRKHIAMRNLYGTDIMADAIETAKLRIFLALAAVLEHASELEPLPDLDFNLKPGNLVVGLYDMADANRINPEGTFADVYDLTEIQAFTSQFQELFRHFKDAELYDRIHVPELKYELLKTQSTLRELTNAKYLEIAGIDHRHHDAWVAEMKPLHWFAEFPEVIERGGFDVVIGNPPYIPISTMDQSSKDAISTFTTSKCPDFYAVCFERSMQLLSKTGRHAFVVMHNLASGSQYASLRTLISEKQKNEYWSTFGKLPIGLFRGVKIRNTILIQAPGDIEKFSTIHHILTQDARPNIFKMVEYSEIKRAGDELPARAGSAHLLLDRILNSIAARQDQVATKIYLRPLGGYGVSVLPSVPPILNRDESIAEAQDKLKALNVPGVSRSIAITLFAGKLGYLWWQSFGNDMHTKPTDFEGFIRFISSLSISSELEKVSETILNKAKDSVFGSLNAGKVQVNIRWRDLNNSFDQFDRLLLGPGSEAERRGLNVWYRQMMRANGVSSKNRILSEHTRLSVLNFTDS